MKKRYIIIITIIVLAHIGFLWLFVIPKHEKAKKNNATEENLSDTTKRTHKTEKAIEEKSQGPNLKRRKAKKYKNRRQSGIGKMETAKYFPHKFNYKYVLWGSPKEIPDTRFAKTGILVYADKGIALWAKNPNQPVPIASMTKMMTILVAMEKIDSDPDITLNTMVKVTPSAAKIGGSQVWLDPREQFSLSDLLKTLAIKSANDSAELIAEFFGGGDRDVFVAEMNKKARTLQLTATHFSNPHGLPEKRAEDENKSSAHDLAVMAECLLRYPKVVKWSSTWIDYIRKNTKKPTMLRNHNHLIRSCRGVDGMKTGYTKKAKFCITVTCKRAGKRLIAVVTGVQHRKQRDSLVRKLLEWGYDRLKILKLQ